MIEMSDINFTYDSGNSKSLCNINLKIHEGECLLVTGKSGCGKTSLVRLINGLIPNFYKGELSGQVCIKGRDISSFTIKDISRRVGSVFQNPKSQFFNAVVKDELAFKSENYRESPQSILEKIDDVLHEQSMMLFKNRNLFSLSGGEKQKIACLSISVYDTEVIVLDEPSSNLDVKSIKDLTKIIISWKAKGKTVIVAEHRLSYLISIADRVIYMAHGEILNDYPMNEFCALSDKELNQKKLRAIHSLKLKEREDVITNEYLVIKNLLFGYDKRAFLKIDNLVIPKATVVGVLGYNGAGKSTFANCLCGQEKRAAGSFVIDGAHRSAKKRLKLCYMVMQDCNHQLFTESVEEEILLSMETKDPELRERALTEVLESLNLTDCRELHPMSLSGGQKQRVVIACALVSARGILIFDEPTSGLDYENMLEVAKCIKLLSQSGKTVFIISHDPELINETCNYLMFLEKGELQWWGAAKDHRADLEYFFK